MSFQTCMSFFLMLNIKEDILKNAGKQKELMVPIDFLSNSSPTIEVNGDHQLFVSSKYMFSFNKNERHEGN